MSQANVYTSVANAQWYTDKVAISTGNTAVTFNVYAPALNFIQSNGVPAVAVAAVGNIYSNAVSVPSGQTQTHFVGAGNYLTITGSNFTAREVGTQSSAAYAVLGTGSN